MTSNPLTDVLTPRLRRYAYAVLFLLAVVFSAWQVAAGDWVEFAGGLVTALLGLMAGSNVDTGGAHRGERT